MRLDIDKKGLQNQSIVVWGQTLKKGTLYLEKTKVSFKFSKNCLLDKKGMLFCLSHRDKTVEKINLLHF